MQVGEFLKQTLLSTLMAAWTWPSYIVKSFKYIDSPWTVGIDRADKAGAVLAQVLLVRGWRWLTPVAEFLTRRCTTGSQTGAAACDVVWVRLSHRCVRLQHAHQLTLVVCRYSIGARVVFVCLEHLAKAGDAGLGIVEHGTVIAGSA